MSIEPIPMPDSSQPPEDSLNNKLSEKNNQVNPLTCIQSAYTLAYTEDDGSELDKLMVKTFIEVLVDVAMSVAARKSLIKINKAEL